MVLLLPWPFLVFLPPLWPFFPDLVVVVLDVAAFFPGGCGCGFDEPLSPPVCAMTRPAPRNNVITNVEIFFIRFSDQNFFRIFLRVPPGKPASACQEPSAVC